MALRTQRQNNSRTATDASHQTFGKIRVPAEYGLCQKTTLIMTMWRNTWDKMTIIDVVLHGPMRNRCGGQSVTCYQNTTLANPQLRHGTEKGREIRSMATTNGANELVRRRPQLAVHHAIAEMRTNYFVAAVTSGSEDE